nr:galectin-5-like [Misgurnus anguillicaudatus]
MASENIKLPYKSIIDGGLQPGKSFLIRGVVNPNPYRIKFNLRHRFGIAFHYNPRFDQNKVVCNTWDCGWGEAEYSASVPFVKGQPFEVTIYCASNHFDVSVDGKHAFTYAYRFQKLNEIDVFEVLGDAQLTCVQAA